MNFTYFTIGFRSIEQPHSIFFKDKGISVSNYKKKLREMNRQSRVIIA